MHLRIGKKVQLQNGNNSKCKIEIKVQLQMEMKMKIQSENENKRPFENWTKKSIKITKIKKWWIRKIKIQLENINENSIRKF